MILSGYINKAGILLLAFALWSCSSAHITSGGGKTPRWVKERPVNNGYYTGIGVAPTHEANYMKVAKNNALTDLISEISVTISGNSVLHQLEDESGFREEFESYTRTSMKDHLEGYELVDSYTGDDHHWVYYRLSVEKYNRLKREKLEKAKNLARDFYEKAVAAEADQNIHHALNYYVKAFNAVKPYLDEDLSIFLLDHGRINLGNAIYQNIQEIFSSIRVKPQKEVFSIRALSASNQPVSATVYYEKDDQKYRVSGLPFLFTFPDLDIMETEEVQSSESGQITSTIAGMAPKGKQQRIKATLNTDIYFGEDGEDNLLQQLFSLKGSVPSGYLTVHVSDLNAWFEASEETFGNTEPSHPVANIFKKMLTENFFSLVSDQDEADVIIQVTANTTRGKFMEKYGLYTAYLTCNISVINAGTQAEVYSTGLQNIKGMKTGSYEMAAMDARQKAEKQIKQNIIPELRNIKF